MFQDWLSGELRSWYVQSPHKDRIDLGVTTAFHLPTEGAGSCFSML